MADNFSSVSTRDDFIKWIRRELKSPDSDDQKKSTDWPLDIYARKFDAAKSFAVSLSLPDAVEILGSSPDVFLQHDETMRRFLCEQIRLKFLRLLEWLDNSDPSKSTPEKLDARNDWFIEQRKVGRTWGQIFKFHFAECNQHDWKFLRSQTAIAKQATKRAAEIGIELPQLYRGGRPKRL